jgi:hypothetical protein
MINLKSYITTVCSLIIFIIFCIILISYGYSRGNDSRNIFFLKEAIVDLGEVKQSVVKFEFIFVNKSSTPIKILGATTTCDCTVYDGKQIEVPTNASVPVSLRIFNRQDEPNDFLQDITFYYTNEYTHLGQGKIKKIIGSVRGRFVGPMFDDRILSPPQIRKR